MPKPLLVFLPGMLCDERLFAPQAAHFSASHEIFVGKLTGASIIEGIANHLLAEIKTERFSLAGLSMGGIVAMEMAEIAPQRIERLALLDTNHLADTEIKRANRNRQISEVRAGNLREVVVDEMKPNYVARAHRENQDLLDLLVQMAMDLGKDVFISQSEALRDRKSYHKALSDFTKPALVLCGKEDTLCPVSTHREIDDLLPKSHLEIIPQAGHISTLENSQAVNAALESWLNHKPGETKI